MNTKFINREPILINVKPVNLDRLYIYFNYFKSSIGEINLVDNTQALMTNEEKGFFTCLLSNRGNNHNAYITINLIERHNHFGDLSYTFGKHVNSTHRLFNWIRFLTLVMMNLYNFGVTKRNGFTSYTNTNDEQQYDAKQIAEKTGMIIFLR